MIFANLPEITEHLAFAIAGKVEGARAGFSNVSCSSYVRFEDREVRLSDHSDRHYEDGRYTIRVDERAEELTDEDGDFDGFEVADWWIADVIDEASKHLVG